MNESVQLCSSVLDLSKTPKHEFKYDYINAKHGNSSQFYFLGTCGFILLFKIEDVQMGFEKVVKALKDELQDLYLLEKIRISFDYL